jgi:two-component system, OmpR family, response regulator
MNYAIPSDTRLTAPMNKAVKILIVDDEVDICFLLSSILRQRSYITSYVNSIAAAKSALQNETPSLLFLDNYLPDGLGLDFLVYVKQQFPAIKIIMITAHDGIVERSRAAVNGADMFLSKPFTRESIQAAVSKLL